MLNYKAYFLDLDGTVYKGKAPIKEAVEFLEHLHTQGIAPFFVTNNSSMTQKQLQEKLAEMNIITDEEHIMTSSLAAANYIDENYKGKKVFMIGEAGLVDALNSKDIETTEDVADVVVMGIDRNINYDKLAKACLSVRAGAALLSTNGDHAFPNELGLVPGNGAFTKLVEYSTGVNAQIMGKPQSFMLEFIQKKYGFEKDEMVMIGDNYQTDILTGINMGIHTVHVNSGVDRTEDIKRKERQPTFYVESLRELIK